MKYLSPNYTLTVCESKDVITVSNGYTITEDAVNDKAVYSISPEAIFGF